MRSIKYLGLAAVVALGLNTGCALTKNVVKEEPIEEPKLDFTEVSLCDFDEGYTINENHDAWVNVIENHWGSPATIPDIEFPNGYQVSLGYKQGFNNFRIYRNNKIVALAIDHEHIKEDRLGGDGLIERIHFKDAKVLVNDGNYQIEETCGTLSDERKEDILYHAELIESFAKTIEFFGR